MPTSPRELNDAPLLSENTEQGNGGGYGAATQESIDPDSIVDLVGPPKETPSASLTIIEFFRLFKDPAFLLSAIKSPSFLFKSMLFLGSTSGFLFLLSNVIYLMTIKGYPQLGGTDCSNSFFLGDYEPCDDSVGCTDVFGKDANFSFNGYGQPQLAALCKNLACLMTFCMEHDFWQKVDGYSLKSAYADTPSNTIEVIWKALVMLLLMCFSPAFLASMSKIATDLKNSKVKNEESKSITNQGRLEALMKLGYNEANVPKEFYCVILLTLMTYPVWDREAAHDKVKGLNRDGSPVARMERSAFWKIEADARKLNQVPRHPITRQQMGTRMFDQRMAREIDDFLKNEEEKYKKQDTAVVLIS